MPKTSLLPGSFTVAEFDAAMTQMPLLGPKARDAARAVLVDGRSPADVAAELGHSRQWVHMTASKVYRLYVPDTWQSAVVCLPPEMLRQVLETARQTRHDYFDRHWRRT